MAKIELSAIRKSFGDTEVLKGVDLSIHDGEFVSLVGPSGCGKSTTALAVLRLVEALSGRIVFDGEEEIGRASCRERV